MSWSGLMPKFKKNRPLTEYEIEDKLEIKTRRDDIPNHGVSVIKMNSTYMDTVDKFYAWKGVLTAPTLFGAFPIFGGFIIFITCLTISSLYIDIKGNSEDIIFGFWVFITLLLSGLTFCCWVSLHECFKYTHYPIRFNRQNRMVYVHRLDGSILKASWDKLHFNLARGSMGTGDWEIHAHVLSEDKQTVLETFGFSVATEFKDYTLNYWEFIRRYMEEGPAQCYYDPDKGYKLGEVNTSHLTFCNDVDGKRESPKFSHQRIKLNFYGNVVYYYFSWPFIKLLCFARVLAMKSCKVLQWPEEVEAECPIAPDDPYITTAADNIKITLVYSEVPKYPKELRDLPIEQREPPPKAIKFRADDAGDPKKKKKKNPKLPRHRQ